MKVTNPIATCGFDMVPTISRCIQSLPDGMTSLQRVRVISDCASLPVDRARFLTEFIESHCPSLLETFKDNNFTPVTVLAPPVSTCYDCDEDLVAYHECAVNLDICSWRLLNHDAPLMLGRPGVVVHIDESFFRHKPKVWYSCMASSLSDCQHFCHDILQSHRGRPPQRQVWVFGICDTSHTQACGVMRIVPDRFATTLLPIIQ